MTRSSKAAAALALLLVIGACVRAARPANENVDPDVIARDEAGAWEVRRLLRSPLDGDAGSDDPVARAIARAEATCILGNPRGSPDVWISASDDFDPGWEFGSTGYVLKVRDGGAIETLYVGLPTHAPYELCQPGFISVHDGKITVEARARKPKTLTKMEAGPFSRPPPENEDPTPLAVTLDLSVLRRDSDRDGLTDIQETRLLCDPLRSDTDGDGRSDDEDVNPVEPFTDGGATSDRSALRDEAVKLALAKVGRKDARKLVIFESAEGFDFREAPYRLLTLSHEEVGAYQARFGQRDIHEVHVRACTADPCPRNRFGSLIAEEPFQEGMSYAIVHVSGAYWGHTYEARRLDGGWRLTLQSVTVVQR